MTSAQSLALIVTLAGLLAIASAVAGALWWKTRSWPLVRAARLARDLADRLEAVEEILRRQDSPKRLAPLSIRIDRAEPTAVAGPTLIAVPDLAATAPPAPGDAAAGLAERFGVLWDLAEAGASPEAIARRTGQPIGQVELILGLRRQLQSAEARG